MKLDDAAWEKINLALRDHADMLLREEVMRGFRTARSAEDALHDYAVDLVTAAGGDWRLCEFTVGFTLNERSMSGHVDVTLKLKDVITVLGDVVR